MTFSESEKKALAGVLSARSDTALTAIREKSEQVLAHLQDLNSEYPETRKFLEARGLTNVSQLDDAGEAELMAHLKSELDKITQ